MKRMISITLSLVMLIMAIAPSCAFAEGKLIKTYDSIIITVSPNSNLETDFREFVKELSKEYYSGVYDLNKYYYEAAKVKYEWDDGGFGWSRRNNPYSTYENYSDYNTYNVPVIQTTLIHGLQEKAESIKKISAEDYSFGLSVNPLSGDWEVNGKAIIAQETYNTEVARNIEIAQNTLAATLVNSLADVAVVAATKGAGKYVDAYAYIMDATTNILADALNAYAEAEYTNLLANLKNNYRELMTQSLVAMQENIEEQLLEDYIQLYDELCRMSALSSDEKLLKEELGKLLDTVKKMRQPTLSSLEEEQIQAAAEELVDSIGLEEIPLLTNEEFTAQIINDIMRSLVINVTDAVLKILMGDNLNWGLTIGKDMIINEIDRIWETITNVEIMDHNGDGAYDATEILLNALSGLIDQNILRDVMAETLEYFLKKTSIKNLDAQIDEAQKFFEKVNSDYLKKVKGRPSNSNVKAIQLKKDMEDARKHRDQVKKANDKMKDKIDTNKGIGIIVDDIVNIACDLFNYTTAAAGIGDQADGEVYYAYFACSMYHTMKTAETRRQSLQKEYISLKTLSNIDTTEISVLKQFVNRIYAVYETDILGHSDYLTLDMGWHYQNGEKLQDAINEFKQLQSNMDSLWGWAGKGLSWVYYPIYSGIGKSKSEFLKEVNKQKEKGKITYGWISLDKANQVYEDIAQYANHAKMPEQYKQLGK